MNSSAADSTRSSRSRQTSPWRVMVGDIAKVARTKVDPAHPLGVSMICLFLWALGLPVALGAGSSEEAAWVCAILFCLGAPALWLLTVHQAVRWFRSASGRAAAEPTPAQDSHTHQSSGQKRTQD